MLFDDGLDTIELINAIEATFDLPIPNRDAERIHTAGDLADYVSRAVHATSEPSDHPTCLSAAAFRQTRSRLSTAFGTPRREIQPNLTLERFLPHANRRAAWRSLQATLGVQLPPLEFPQKLAAIPLVIAFVGAIAGVASVSPYPVLGGAAGFLVSVIALGLAELAFGTRLPQRCNTVGALSTLLIPNIAASAKSHPRRWCEPEVWQTVRSLIARAADVPPKSITRQTDLIRDLI